VTVHLLAAGPDWGTVPDWLAAVGTLAAFAVALRLLGKELAARREAEEDHRREQARRVSVWATEIEQVPPALGSLVFFVVRANRSDEPVYDVLIEMASNDPGGAWAPWRKHIPVMPPGQEQTRLQVVPYRPGPVTLTFTDAVGRRWKRYPDGRLVEPDRPRGRSRKDYINAWIAGELDHLDY